MNRNKILLDAGAMICPVCRRKIKGTRVLPDFEMQNISIRCNWCKHTFLANGNENGLYYMELKAPSA